MTRTPSRGIEVEQPHVATIEVGGRSYGVSVRIEHDGVEYVGRLWFADEAWDDAGIRDRGALPGRTPADVLAMATGLRPEELEQRYQRALAEKRRYRQLRRVTEDMLAKVRYMNQLAVSMRAGLLDVDGAAQEIQLTERQLHVLVGAIRHVAGLEDAIAGDSPAGT